ncbi:putative disease resistance RPP13 protein 1 [Spatholobus suberectus]|nr:putative disease resistance RPP13 protein 1 [Spatholobus suberectus]
MAVAFVGEAFLSAVVEVLLDRIISHEVLDFYRRKKLGISLLKKLRITLLSLQAVLNDTEEKQITNPAVKEWLDELTHAVFDADNLLDQINTEALRCKLEANSLSQDTSDQVLNFFSSPFNPFQKVIHSKIQALFQRLEQFALEKDILQLKEGVSSSVWHETPTSSVVDESTIYGRDGGLRKTTLTKLLYNDQDVQEKFDLKAWAYISNDFDVCRVSKTILESVTFRPLDTNNLNILQVELQESLRHRRFLLVLDDIWNGNYVDWNNLMDIFSTGKMGSKIIITTRDVLPALLLSYHNLPAPLKRCFTYLSIFPKNSQLVKEMVVRLWIAEGLVCQSKSDKTMEEVSDEYFDELVSRSLIHRGSLSGQANFKMHDLINDLATMISSSYCIRYEDPMSRARVERVRHLSYNKGKYDSFNKFDCLYESKGLRTFIALPLRLWWLRSNCFARHYLSNKVIHGLVPAMRQLRVLSLSHYVNISELPDYLGSLIYLRYLDLSNTKIQRLPDQTAGWIEGWRAEKFPHLKGKLSILKLQNVVDPSETFQANLKKKEQIEELALEWDCGTTEDTQIERLVLEQLQPPINLKKLTIKFYGGTSFPNWLGDSSFGNMVYLCMSGCDHCWSLPPLGRLISLKELHISGMKSVKTIGTEFYGSDSPSFQLFPSLEILTFKEMLEWEEWNLIGGTAIEFPSLLYLSLKDCPKLKGTLPSNLPFSINFELCNCPLLVPMVCPELTENLSTNLLPSIVLKSTNFILDLTISGLPPQHP